MSRTINDGVESDDEESGPAAPAHTSLKMTKEELKVELDRRTALLQEGAVEGLDTDQWRVFCYIVEVLTSGNRYLRLLVQASAGTGKSFLLSTVAYIVVSAGNIVVSSLSAGLPLLHRPRHQNESRRADGDRKTCK